MKFNWRAGRNSFFATALIIFLILGYLLVSKRPIVNYSDPDEPFYEGNFSGEQDQFDGRLRIVTWNLHFSEKLNEAIATLQNTEELQNADILLLQEMDTDGAETLARRLRYNYVYYPAAAHRQRKEGYGNTIFSKFELLEPTKIVLPNWLPGLLQSRNAARALITIGNRKILIYSVHLDTVWMVPFWTRSQGEFLVDEIANQQDFAILGGDFNTWSPDSIAILEYGLEKVNLKHLSSGTGYTFESSGLRLTLDHIFAEDKFDFQTGVFRQTNASDHYPVWVEMIF